MNDDPGVFPHEPCMTQGCGHRYDDHHHSDVDGWFCRDGICPCERYTGPPIPSHVCQNPRCAHLYTEHGTLGCRMTKCHCEYFDTQLPRPPQENPMKHPELIAPGEEPEEAPVQLYRVTLTLDVDVVSRDGFSGAADAALYRARRVFDSTTADKATVVAVSVSA